MPSCSEIPFHAEAQQSCALFGNNFHSYMIDLENASTPFKGVGKALVDTLLDGCETARCLTKADLTKAGVFGHSE